MNNLTKENILDRVSDHQIFNHFLSEYNSGKQLKEGVHIPNPIVLKNEGRRQKTPSFNITYYNGKWFFKDFAEEWCHGDVFEFIQMLYKTDLKGALQVINDSMGLMLNG